jgi:hypothetical protein
VEDRPEGLSPPWWDGGGRRVEGGDERPVPQLGSIGPRDDDSVGGSLRTTKDLSLYWRRGEGEWDEEGGGSSKGSVPAVVGRRKVEGGRWRAEGGGRRVETKDLSPSWVPSGRATTIPRGEVFGRPKTCPSIGGAAKVIGTRRVEDRPEGLSPPWWDGGGRRAEGGDERPVPQLGSIGPRDDDSGWGSLRTTKDLSLYPRRGEVGGGGKGPPPPCVGGICRAGIRPGLPAQDRPICRARG